jgi:hypothetical protein
MRAIFRMGFVVMCCLAFLPTLASAAPPAPKGKLVYQDDFSDPRKSGLEDNLTATDYSRGFHDPGVYHLKNIKNGETHWSLFPRQKYANLTVELDVWDNSDDFKGDISEGVIVRAQDPAHFYTVLIDTRKGQYAVRKQDGAGKWTDLIAWKPSSLIKQRSDINHLRVDADGNTFTIYLNDSSLDSFSDSSYSKGSIGLISSNVDAATNHMHFDNVKAYTTDPQPASLPNTSEPAGVDPLLLAGFALLLLGLGAAIHQRRGSTDE